MSSIPEEKEFKWAQAAEAYEKTLESETASSPSRVKILQKIGDCYSFASRQATEADNFKQLRLLSISAYNKAAEAAENEELKEICFTKAAYTKSWLASSHVEKIEALDECKIHAQKAIEAQKSSGVNGEYTRTAILLLQCLFDRLYLSVSLHEMIELAEQAIALAEATISVSKQTDAKDELVFAYSLGSLHAWYIANISESEHDRKDYGCKSVSYAENAITISKEIDNPHSKAISFWAGAFSSLYFTENIDNALQNAKDMLDQAEIASDSYLKGIAYYLLAHALDFKITSEANPDKRKQMYDNIIKYAEEGIRYLDATYQDTFMADTYLFPVQTYSALASEFALSLPEKVVYSKKAIDYGKKSLEYATRSGASEAMISALHGLSKAYHYHAILEQRVEAKAELLRNALNLRKELVKLVENVFPTNLWTAGVAMVYAAEIEKDLYNIEHNVKNKPALLQQAIVDIEEGVKRCKNWIVSREVPMLVASVAGYKDTFGGILNEDYLQTSEKQQLYKANQAFGEAAEGFRQVSMPTRAAESHWKIASNLDQLNDYEQASDNFERAFASFKAAAKKIVNFGNFYLDYALYMKAWSEIECAKGAHTKGNYAKAMEQYEKTAQLLRQSELWKYLSLNYYAWSLLEQAEDYSRKENSNDSIEAFEKAAKFFQESKRILAAKLDKIERKDEKDSVKRLIQASDMREEYSRGRIIIEEAKTLDKKSDPIASSAKYEAAAEVFNKIVLVDSGIAGKEAKLLVYLCRAWQKMTLAGAKGSPIMYEEAAELFRQAYENALNESTGLIALGHSDLCKALEAGTEFEMTKSLEMYEESSKHFASASQNYLSAGLEAASEYAKATQYLLDTNVLVENAKRERDHGKQTLYYSKAEKALRDAADSYNKANHPEKVEKTERLLDCITKREPCSVPLTEVFSARAITSTTSSFSALGLEEEKAVGLERFEQADIQVLLVQHEIDIKVGETFSLDVQFINVGKKTVILNKIENMVPSGFQLVSKPEYCSFANTNLTIRGKTLEPLATYEVKLTLKSFIQGAAEIKPRVVCVDDIGRQIFFYPERAVFNVSGATLAGRVSTGYPDLDNLLFGGLPENYNVLLSAPSVDERELLIKKFLETGAKNDQITLFITVDPGDVVDLAEKYPSNFYLIVCSPRSEVLAKNLPNVFRLKGVEALVELDIAVVKALRMMDLAKNCPKRACINTISDVLLQHHAVFTRKWLNGILPDLKSKGFTTLAVVNPQMHPSEEYQAILGLFEGEIRISEKETENGLDKLLRIRKLYNQRYLENEITLTREKLEA